MALSPAAPDKSIAPVMRKAAPSREQVQLATTLRSLGISPNNPKQQQKEAVKAGMSWEEWTKTDSTASPFLAAHNSKAVDNGLRRLAQVTGFKGSYADEVPFEVAGANEGGPTSTMMEGLQLNADFAKHLGNFQFRPLAGERPSVNVFDAAGRLLGPVNYGSKDSAFDKFVQIAIPAVLTSMAGGAFSSALGLTGAAGAATTGAVGSGLNTAVQGGKFSDVLKSAATGGLGGGLTSGLTSAGFNPLAARAVSSLATGAVTGRDPRQSLLSAIIGGVNVGNPVANAFLRAMLSNAVAPKKKGKP